MSKHAAREWFTVERPEAVKLCLSQDYAPVLEALMLHEQTVSEVARLLNLPLHAAFHRVERLLSAGLIQVTRLQPRQGRAIRHYRAVAEAFLIPYRHTTLSTLEELVNLHGESFQERLNRAVVQAASVLVHNEAEIGLRIFRDGDSVNFDVTPRAENFDFAELLLPDRPALLVNWGHLHLTRAQAKGLQHELNVLASKYMNLNGPETYLFRVALAPDLDDG